MGRILLAAAMAAALSSCATAGSFRAENRMNLLRLEPGMDRGEVTEIMGIGEHSVCCPIRTVTNPHRTEAYAAGGSRFEVLYYYTDERNIGGDGGSSFSGAIQEDELVPIVIRDGELDGWGWSYWNDLVERYEIRVR